MTKSTLVRVPVSLRGVLCAALVWGGSVDLAAQETLDLKDWNEANSLVAKNELASALEILKRIPLNYPTSPYIPMAAVRQALCEFALTQFDEALRTLDGVPALKGMTPEVIAEARFLRPRVLAQKSLAMPKDNPLRDNGLLEALNEFDKAVAEFPRYEGVEGALYEKSRVQFGMSMHREANEVLTKMFKLFPKGSLVNDGKILQARILRTFAYQSSQKEDAPKDKIAEAFKGVEGILEEVIRVAKDVQTLDLAVYNEAYMDLGETRRMRATVLSGDDKAAATESAVEAYGKVLAKETVLEKTKGVMTGFAAVRAKAERDRDLNKAKALERIVDRLRGKLDEVTGNPDASVEAKFQSLMALMSMQETAADRARVMARFLLPLVEDKERKAQLQYVTGLTYAWQDTVPKAMEAYKALRGLGVKADGHQQLPLQLAFKLVETAPEDSVRLAKEIQEDYPGTEEAARALTITGIAMQKLGKSGAESREVFLKAVEVAKDPVTKSQAQLSLAGLLLKERDLDGALAAFMKLRDEFSEQPTLESAMFRVGEVLFYKQDFAGAQRELEGFSDRYPKSEMRPSARYLIGKALNAQGQREKALAAFEGVIKDHAETPYGQSSYFDKANILIGMQRIPDADATLREFVKAYPENENIYAAYAKLAEISESKQEFATAAGIYELFLKEHGARPEIPTALYRFGLTQKSLAEAIGRYITLNNEQKDNWDALMSKAVGAAWDSVLKGPEGKDLAAALRLVLDVQTARRNAKRVTNEQLEKEFDGVIGKLGEVKDAQRRVVFAKAALLIEVDKDKALAAMKGAYDAGARYLPEDLELLGATLIEKKLFKEAEEIFQKIAADYPVPEGLEDHKKLPKQIQYAQASALYGLGKCLMEQDKVAEARKKFEELEKNYPWSSKRLEASYGIAEDLFRAKEYDGARKRLGDIAKSNAASAETRAKSMFLIGKIHEEQGVFDAAIDNYLKIPVFFESVATVSAEGLWRGATLLEKQGRGELPKPSKVKKPAAAEAKDGKDSEKPEREKPAAETDSSKAGGAAKAEGDKSEAKKPSEPSAGTGGEGSAATK
jgi:TolA-binding protein